MELSYTFGGCTVLSASGSFRSQTGIILPDKIHILFTDVDLELKKDRLSIGQYVGCVTDAIQAALADEESILISIHPIYHAA
jgi:hypothetical protein